MVILHEERAAWIRPNGACGRISVLNPPKWRVGKGFLTQTATAARLGKLPISALRLVEKARFVTVPGAQASTARPAKSLDRLDTHLSRMNSTSANPAAA